MLTGALRILLGHQLAPYAFRKALDVLPDFDVPNLGVYVHVPFCKELCPFCPYFKARFDSGQAASFLSGLVGEIDLVVRRAFPTRRQITSVYFGGGSPALLLDGLATVNSRLREHFDLSGHVGIELHPRDVTARSVSQFSEFGFDMVSLGVQSFLPSLLHNLGRPEAGPLESLRLLSRGSYQAVDVDLIFGIPGQSASDLRRDFLTAVDNGATQISTYPFIDFSYTNALHKPLGHFEKKRLLEVLLATAHSAGFERSSVWTFAKRDTPQYSSITRDTFIGFGPSASSLGRDTLKINTFSLDAYVQSVQQNRVPTALKMDFSRRSRGLYWLFWNCYNGKISELSYERLLGRSLGADFGVSLRAAQALGILRKSESVWELTDYGSYLFHCVEQVYTHQYIDRTWNCAMKSPWPEEVLLY
jgi:oxygen-independent coproporphyrinogen-3 oxidase